MKKYDTKVDIFTPKESEVTKLSMNITGKVTTTAINTELASGLSNKDGLFNVTVDTSNLTDGLHLLKIKLLTKHLDETIYEVTRKITIKKYDGIITLDFPSSGSLNKNNDIFVRGWEMSEDINSKVMC